MKTPIALISNDWHLTSTNIESVENIIDEKIKLAQKLKVSDIFVLGDVFDDRRSQRQNVLNAFKRILTSFKKAHLNVHIVVGNHDRSDYSLNESFLSVFDDHDNGIFVWDDFNDMLTRDVQYIFAPFFSEEIWLEKFKNYNFDTEDKKVILTHVAFNGSINNDGTTISSPIKPSLFKGCDLVLSGHYHNAQQVSLDIHHLPSLYQRNYGEDEDKGFTVLYDDLSFELHKSTFPTFNKLVIDLDTVTKKELEENVKAASEDIKNGNNVRFEFRGSETKVKALKKDLYTANGIDVVTKIKEIEESEIEIKSEIQKLDKETIKNKFVSFCDNEELDLEQGQKYLHKILE